MDAKWKDWEYGGVYKNYDMTGIIKTGMGRVMVHDIYEECPEFLKEADCLFCDPPCSVGNLKTFYTKADRTDYKETYEPFMDRFFKYVDEIQPKIMYVEVFASNKNAFIKECEKRFKYVTVDDSYYYHNKKNRCWIIRCGHEEEAPGPDNMIDEETYIRWICKNVDYKCIADPCIGRGLVGINSHKNEKKFVGTELNKKRLAILLQRIDDYNAKQTARERKKLTNQKNFQK